MTEPNLFCMTKSEILFWELLRVCIGMRKTLSQSVTDEQWNGALRLAQEQTVVGVLVNALEQLPKEQLPSRLILLQWIGMGELIVGNSDKLTKASIDTMKFFRDNGFACHILKGCSVARYYPVPLRRTSGDVDVWVDAKRKVIYNFARNFDKDRKIHGANYHHIHLHLHEDVHTEVHIWPSCLSSPLRNHRLHKFCRLHRPTMETDKPSLAFDRVFILLHAYQHLCGHGVGLRQLMDYYYVLKQGFTEDEKADAVFWSSQLGMKRFAEGVMWIFQRVFGMEEKYLLFEPNEKEGRFIMREVMLTGNMGHSETRKWGSLKTPLSRFIYNLRRDVYFLAHYPHEAIWQPFFSLYLNVWRVLAVH